MSQSMKTIQEMLGQQELLDLEQGAEMGRRRQRYAQLDDRRKVLLEQVTRDGRDMGTRQKLDETEVQLERLHAEISEHEAGQREARRTIRQRIFDLRNEELSRLEEQARQLRQRRQLVHTELLPEAQRRVEALLDEEAGLLHQLDEIARCTTALNGIDLKSIQVA